MSYLIQSARKLVSVFTEQPTPLEIQMAKQLKEQSLQMEEMKQLMEGMRTLIVKMEAETAHHLSVRTAEAERRAEAKRKVEAERKRKVEAERKRKVEAEHKCKAEQKPEPWTCPTDGMVYPWTYKGVKYLRNSDNQLWMYDGKECGDWKGLYLIAEDRIDESAIDPFEDE